MLTFDARDLNLSIDKGKLKSLYKVRWYRLILDMLLDWAIIIAAIFLCEKYFNPFLYALAVVIIGARMHALAVLMHDAAHFRFLTNKKVNDWVINLFSCYPMFFTIASYRTNHLGHHQHLNTEQDPDWMLTKDKPAYHPKSEKEFLIRLALYFTGIQGIKDVFWLLGHIKKSAPKQKEYGGTIYLIVLFALLTVFGGWKIYLLYWIVPFITSFFLFQYIRAIAEHYGALERNHLLNYTRSINATLIEKFIIAPHNIHYHLEHHLYPGVPYYNLPRLKKLLMEDNTYKSLAHYTNGYFPGLLREVASSSKAATK